MLNLISFFNAESFNIFKYFLLRDRKLNEYGEYVYKTINKKKCKYNTILEHKTAIQNITVSSSEDYATATIPFPFEGFLAKGNKMYVWLNGIKLIEDTDYAIYNYDQIEIYKRPTSTQTMELRFEFYYDKSTIDMKMDIDKNNSLYIDRQVLDTSDPNKSTFDLELPYEDYLKDGNTIIVTVGSLWAPKTSYTVDIINNKITLNSRLDFYNMTVEVLYMYGKNIVSIFDHVQYIAPENNVSRIKIPEPFNHYTINGNEFLLNNGSTWVDPRRYVATDDGYLEFTDGTKMKKNTSLFFNFIYNEKSTYDEINLIHKTQTIIATQYYQYEFDLQLPEPDYITKGYQIYVENLGWFMDDMYFNIFENKLQFTFRNTSLQPGDEIKIHYIYQTNENPHYYNTYVYYESIYAKTPYQSVFTMTPPVDKYFEKGNKIVVSSTGILLTEGVDYTRDGYTITITNPDYRPYKNQKVNIEYIYNQENPDTIKMKIQNIKAVRENQTDFYLKIPFYPYTETGHKYLVAHDSLFVNSNAYSEDKFNITLNSGFSVAKNDIINILYLYNKRYTKGMSDITVVETTVDRDQLNTEGLLSIDVPEPLDDFINNDWPYFIDVNKTWLEDSLYDIINSQMIFENVEEILNHFPYTFTFLYKNASPWVESYDQEDVASNIDLQFLKIPLSTVTNLSKDIKQKVSKSYDSVTLADKFWDGDHGDINDEKVHEELKQKILELDFNYARTKYITVEYLTDLTEMAFQIAYFYNTLWDDVYKEDKLNVIIPNLSPSTPLNIGHVFCYLTALGYLYKDVEDTIMDTPSKIMYVKGFNFKADLEKLKEWILDQRRKPEDYDIFDFQNPDPEFESFSEFLNTYKTNKKIYETIVRGMKEADTYDIYCIWKKMYDSLMVWKFNLDYFKISVPIYNEDGFKTGEYETRVAKTFTEFLRYKQPILATSIDSIAMVDPENKKETIVNTIQNIVYILDEYIDSVEFRHIYSMFPGASADSILEYLFTIINFFKSYKIGTVSGNVSIIAGNYNDDNYVRPVDRQIMATKLEKPDYATAREVSNLNIKLLKQDSISETIHEKIKFSYN